MTLDEYLTQYDQLIAKRDCYAEDGYDYNVYQTKLDELEADATMLGLID